MPYLFINKPAGMTSHDVVDHIRNITSERTVGHAGTLDPFATGLLILGVGRESTKHLNAFLGMDKTYRAIILIGKDSTTLDPEGEISDAAPGEITIEAMTNAIQSLTGDLQQIPPMHSAIKIGGKKLYELARKGIEVERPPRAVTVKRFAIDPKQSTAPSFTFPFSLPVTIECTSGTYIRAIARDLGEALGTKAYLTALERTAIGQFSLSDAVPLGTLKKEHWQEFAKNINSDTLKV